MSGFDTSGYIDVAERLRMLKDRYPDASLQGQYEIVMVNGTEHVVYRAECYRTPDDQRPGVGYAWEQVPGKTAFTKTSELMNAETSAWGRAIVAALAAETKRVASAEEIQRHEANTYIPPAEPLPPLTAEEVEAMNPAGMMKAAKLRGIRLEGAQPEWREQLLATIEVAS